MHGDGGATGESDAEGAGIKIPLVLMRKTPRTMLEVLTNCLYSTIYWEAIGNDSSPYGLLKKKLYSIDTDYFERIPAWTEKLPETLNVDLLSKIMDDFRLLVEQKFNSDFEEKLLNRIHTMIQESSPNADSELMAKACQIAKEQIHKTAGLYFNYTPCPRVQLTEVLRKYQEAREITLGERIRGNNNADVLDFHHALMYRTIWDCKKIIDDGAIMFTDQLLERIGNGTLVLGGQNNITYDANI